jgi:hypothetical protein
MYWGPLGRKEPTMPRTPRRFILGTQWCLHQCHPLHQQGSECHFCRELWQRAALFMMKTLSNWEHRALKHAAEITLAKPRVSALSQNRQGQWCSLTVFTVVLEILDSHGKKRLTLKYSIAYNQLKYLNINAAKCARDLYAQNTEQGWEKWDT